MGNESPMRGSATKLRQAREAAGLTQPALAKLAGYSAQSVSNHETGSTVIKANALAAYAKALGLRMEDLVDDEDGDSPERLPPTYQAPVVELVRLKPEFGIEPEELAELNRFYVERAKLGHAPDIHDLSVELWSRRISRDDAAINGLTEAVRQRRAARTAPNRQHHPHDLQQHKTTEPAKPKPAPGRKPKRTRA